MSLGPWLLVLEVKPVWASFAFLMGLLVGSFANVCIHRLPRGESVVTPPSRCPGCGARIPAWANVPLVSYLLLRGRCRSCRAPISLRYPAVEAANGLLYAATALIKGPTPDALLSMAFLTALLVLALVDLEHHLLPNAITLPGIVVGIAASPLTPMPTPLGGFVLERLCPPLCVPAPALEAGAAALIGYLALGLVALLARLHYKEEALGRGDWKLVAMIGAFRGCRGMWLAMFVGTFLGAVVGIALVIAGRAGRRTPVPLGTFLCAGAVLELFAGAQLLAWYRGLFPH